MKRLKVHPDKRYLMWEDGTPFFYMGDTIWELFHKLSYEEAEQYLTIRERQGFNVIQAVCLAELDGIGTPNYYGEPAVLSWDEEKIVPNEKYFAHVDAVIDLAGKHGIFVALLPTWGDKFNKGFGKGPEILTPANAEKYAAWLAARYSGRENIIWVLGGDRPLENERHRAVIDAMGSTLRRMDKNHLITFHPPGATSSCEFVPHKDYIDFHMNQSGHDVDKCFESDVMLEKCFLTDAKPAMDGESRYEDHPACFRPEFGYIWNCNDIRQNFYINMMRGACGQTYGNHSVWSCCRKPDGYFLFAWNEVLEHPGAEQFRHLKELRLSRPFFELRPANELLVGGHGVRPKTCAARGKDYAFVYTPLGLPVTVDLGLMGSNRVKASWFDPRTGEVIVDGIYGLGVYQFAPFGQGQAKYEFAPPRQGKGCDMVLILDNLYC